MALMTPQFSDQYSRLNPEQRQAVDTIEGPVMVMAGPGTGKTQVLACRIAQILLKTDVQPHNILALTFTDAAAQNMRERLFKLIGTAGYKVQVHTFHSFCQDVIKTYPEYFPLSRLAQPLTDLEKFAVIEKILLESKLEVLKPINSPLFYLRECLTQISQLKREGVSVKSYQALVSQAQKLFDSECDDLKKGERARREKELAKQSELIAVYSQYQDSLTQLSRYDFDDMILMVREAFSNHEELLLQYQEVLQYFLVDEYQDTNTAQNSILELLSSYWGEQANICVVGDPHQSIFRFQGASIENTLGFSHRYPDALIVTLKQGYRCPQKLYDAAHRVISHNHLTGPLATAVSQRLESQSRRVGSLNVIKAPTQMIEVNTVVETILALIASGVSADEIAVLYRKNKDAELLRSQFDAHGIEYTIDASSSVFESELFQQILTLCRVVFSLRSTHETADLFQLLCYDWVPVENQVIFKLSRIAGHQKKALSEIIELTYQQLKDQDIDLMPTETEFLQVKEYWLRLQEWSALDLTTLFTLWFETVLSDSGLLSWVMSHEQKLDYLTHLTAVMREITSQVSANRAFKLENFLSMVTTMHAHGLDITVEDIHQGTQAVQFSTVHKAKGKEWSHVFVVNAIDGQWGNSKKRSLLTLPDGILTFSQERDELDEDDRRLWYVALTRAKETVTVSYPAEVLSGAKSRAVLPSVFIEEMGDFAYREVVPTDAVIESVLIGQVSVKKTRPRSEQEFFEKVVESFSLSSSALSTYLRDPQEFVLKYLLKIPQATAPTLAYGTAMHAALEKLFRTVITQGSYPNQVYVMDAFKSALSRELIDSDEFERRLAIGQKALTEYLRQLPEEVNPPLYLEKFFGGRSQAVYLDDIPLSGRIDRIDLLHAGNKEIKVIDYKTGKARSANEIEAKTKTAQVDFSERELALPESIRGPYKRQLLFYKLLTELDPQFHFTATVGEFDFVEPSKTSGTLVKRSFDLQQEDVEELKMLIKEVMREIRGLGFM